MRIAFPCVSPACAAAAVFRSSCSVQPSSNLDKLLAEKKKKNKKKKKKKDGTNTPPNGACRRVMYL